MANTVRAFRAGLLHCLDHPRAGAAAVEYFDDGVLIVDQGRIGALGEAADLLPALGGDVEVVDLSGRLIVPGFIDCHVHYPQIDIVASWGAALLDWLERYAYPEEARFAGMAGIAHAKEVANRFADALLANGTTAALVFATVHEHSVTAMFEAAQARGMRLITGKTLMDIAAPPELCDTPDAAVSQSQSLIARWHGVDRLAYAITPRFALTSSVAQLEAAGRLAERHPDVYVHTHLAENEDELAAVAKRFPERRSYLDVYAHYGLVRERSVFAHCVHLDDEDRTELAAANAAIAYCPSSNLFLGSGLFDLEAAERAGVAVGIGTDVGAGPSLNMLETLADAYRVSQLRRQPLDSEHGLYLATLGAARCLGLDTVIGNFEIGKEADFTVLDAGSESPLARRAARAADVRERLFALQLLGDARNVHSTWLLGERAFHGAGPSVGG